MKKVIILTILFMVFGFCLSEEVMAQCAMCKATAEQGDQSGLNLGILYLFLAPYLIVGTIGYFWWRNRKKETSQNNQFVHLGQAKSN